MITGIGTDLMEVGRIQKAIEQEFGLRENLFTETEIAYCEGMKNKFQHYAARYAAKESLLKALGTGWRNGIKFLDIEIYNDKLGNPFIRLTGIAAEMIKSENINQIHVSLSHTNDMAMATVILEKAE
jgi:holo-[acyl-carrier protein] synthase